VWYKRVFRFPVRGSHLAVGTFGVMSVEKGKEQG
jgi:hypothetical protein